ncbi:SDR family NAD(P)-dependent oxidoreductase [Streptomyces sp. NPDC096339]|uniref:SDR family NAD(P)-dependent oxidoreductase n=1 Tax=Streptomyces sp. NPDC096339 TaxID=3366086 RepID=UPI00380DA285
MGQLDLTDKRVLVTGGARGLGAGMARALATAGASVMLGDVLKDAVEQTAVDIAAATGARVASTSMDVTSDGDWAAAVAHTVAEFGGLDVVVNNAGIEVTQLLVDTDPDDIRRMLDVNIIGTMLGIKHGLRAMRRGGTAGGDGGDGGDGGAIVNVASVAATIAFPGIAGYSATKSAVDRLTRVAAAESGRLGYGVRVNCVYPGLVATEMGTKLAVETSRLGLFDGPEAAVEAVVALTPSGRLGEVADMADAVVFLASDASRFVNGAGLSVDGGMGM